MSTQIYDGPGRLIYSTKEEAKLANVEKTKERYRKNRERIRQQQKEYYQKVKAPKKQLENFCLYTYQEIYNQNIQLQQQVIMYQQLMNQRDNNISQSGQQNIILTPNFTLEILN